MSTNKYIIAKVSLDQPYLVQGGENFSFYGKLFSPEEMAHTHLWAVVYSQLAQINPSCPPEPLQIETKKVLSNWVLRDSSIKLTLGKGGEELQRKKVVYFDEANNVYKIYKNTDVANVDKIKGLNLLNSVNGWDVYIMEKGDVSFEDEVYEINKQYYVDENGDLTTTRPTSGLIVPFGISTNGNSLFIDTSKIYEEGSGGSGTVNSVFGRTGIVTAQSGDYNADQITETGSRKFISEVEKSLLPIPIPEITIPIASNPHNVLILSDAELVESLKIDYVMKTTGDPSIKQFGEIRYAFNQTQHSSNFEIQDEIEIEILKEEGEIYISFTKDNVSSDIIFKGVIYNIIKF